MDTTKYIILVTVSKDTQDYLQESIVKMRGFKQLSIKQNIVISMTIVVIIMLILSSSAYYLNFNNSMNKIVETSSKEINKQIILNYENYIDDVIDAARQIQQETIDYDTVSDFVELGDIYNKSANINENVISIVLLDLAGSIIIDSSSNTISNTDLDEKEWFKNALSDDSIFYFSSPHTQDVYSNSLYEVISVTKVISYYANGSKYTGILLIDFSTEKIIRLTHQTNLGEGGHIIILNDDNSLIYSSLQSCFNDTCESREIATNIIIGGSYVNVDGTKMYANVNTLNATRWRIATFTNVEIINTSRTNMLIALIAIMSVSVTFVFYIANVITQRITSPLNKLNKHMLEIQKYGELYRPLEVEGQKEIVILSNAFNNMIAEIRVLMEKVLEEQIEKRKTEFIALQTQINPHFLYNTLDSIIWLSENNMNEQVIEMIVALSKYFRLSISRGNNIITVKEELEHARNYLLIQKIRYSNKFDYTFDIDENANNIKVVKLILQPLIENAIYHGISTDEKGIIKIRSFIENELMVFEIENNGYGLSEKQIEDIHSNIKTKEKKTSIGLKNVYQRLKLYYGHEADLEIRSILDEKTIVRITIPITSR